MNRTALAVAAAVIAGSTMTSAAEAGIRLGFGMPLGSFVASPFSSGAQRSPFTGPSAYKRMCAERQARAAKVAAARQQAAIAARRQAAERAAIAEAQARKAKAAAVARAEAKAAAQAEAKLAAQNGAKDVETAANTKSAPDSNPAPTIFVPDAPTTTAASTASTLTEIAEVGTINDAVTIKADKKTPAKVVTAPVKVATNVTKAKETPVVEAKSVCRRFSPVVGGLVDVPCE